MEGQFRMHQNRFFLEVSQLTFFPNVTCRHDYFHQIWSRKVFSEPKNVIFWYFQVMLEKVMLEKSHVGKTQNRFFPFCDFGRFRRHRAFWLVHISKIYKKNVWHSFYRRKMLRFVNQIREKPNVLRLWSDQRKAKSVWTQQVELLNWDF